MPPNPIKVRMYVTPPGGAQVTVGNELIDVKVVRNLGATLDTFEAVIQNDSGAFTSTFVTDSTVLIDVSLDLGVTWTRLFNGYIELREIGRERTKYNYSTIKIRGAETAVKLLDRLARGTFYNKTVSQIIQALVEEYGNGIGVGTITSTAEVIPQFAFSYQTVMDLATMLTTLPREGEYTFYVDTSGNFHFILKGTGNSVYTFDGTNIEEITHSRDITRLKTGVIVIGGKDYQLDLQELTVSHSFLLSSNHIAQKFTPRYDTIPRIELYIDKIGDPPGDFSGSIRYNVGGSPSLSASGTKEFSLEKEKIGTSPAWYKIDLTSEIKIALGVDYWIKLDKVGDSSNTYRVYGVNTGTNVKDSPDDITWSAYTFTIAHKTYYFTIIITKAQDGTASRQREMIIVDDKLRDPAPARRTAQNLLDKFNKSFNEVTLTAIPPTSVNIELGNLITISDSSSGLSDSEYTVEKIEWKIKPKMGTYTYSLTATASEKAETAEDIIKRHEDRIWEERLGQLGLNEGEQIAWPWSFEETLSMTGTLSKNQAEDWGLFIETITQLDTIFFSGQLSGTFLVDVATVGFSDCL